MIELELIKHVRETKISYEPDLCRESYRGKRQVIPQPNVTVTYDVAADGIVGKNLDRGWFAEWQI